MDAHGFSFNIFGTPPMSPPDARPARLILASASPRRRELLLQLGMPFEVVVADVTEHEDPETDPRVMVAHNAALKADWVAARHPDAVVLGADTTVFLDGKAINKPRDLDDARSMLRRLSGREHTVYTGVAVRRAASGLRIDEGVSSQVAFRSFGDAVIEDYVRLVNTLDKAGAYSIQEQTELIIAGYRGSFSNIMGLPMEATKQILTRGVLQGLLPPLSAGTR
jgi:septum formation protein